MSNSVYDVIVLGAGGVGSAAMWRLAKRGLRVLGIDRFAPPHDRGSSHGQTRIIRQAYFEHPDYVPLLLESYRLWHELEHESGESLLRQTGLIQIGPAQGVVVPGVLRAASQHGLPIERLAASEVVQRWPGFRIPDGLEGAFEAQAGYLSVERCVAACLDAAKAAGASLAANVTVHRWSASDGIEVHTSTGTFHAAKLVIAGGAWAGPLLATLPLGLQVRRKVVMWYDCHDRTLDADAGCPCYLFELPEGVFYGFPAVEGQGLKAGDHSGGQAVNDPLRVDRRLHPQDHAATDAFLRRCLPGVALAPRAHSVCLYTMSPDEQLIVDKHSEHDRVVFAAGLSGHGFKFTPILGEILADLAIDGRSDHPHAFLSAARVLSRPGNP